LKVYHPQIKVTLIKVRRRTEIAPGVPAIQSRYNQFDGIDLTPFLGEFSGVHTTKSTRQPMGGFTLRFADQPHKGKDFLESIYALIEPMDLIQIHMAHSPVALKNQALPLVMRGFVSTVIRQQGMSDRGPQRFITVSGHDFAKVLQIYRVNYLPYTEMSHLALSEFKFFQSFAPDAVGKSMTGNDFVRQVVERIVNPYMADITALANAERLGAKVINQWQAEASIEGSVSPYAVSSFTDESLYGIMRSVLDIGAFNELYLEDTEEAPVLVVRPIPFKDIGGDFIQGSAESLDVSSVDVQNMNVSRSDEGVANYFWVPNNRMAMQTNMDQQAIAAHGSIDSFVRLDYLNCDKSFYGVRKMSAETAMGDELETWSNASRVANLQKETDYALTWQEKRRKLLADMNQDNVVFERGSLRLRGNEAIKAGMYLRFLSGINQSYVGQAYAHTVSHDFLPFNGFFTTVHIDRGTGFIDRAQTPGSPYLAEIEAQGII
jgi:hypothetical protein